MVTLYSQPDCHLCDEARAELDAAGLPYEEVDISSDPALHARYLERVPVVAFDAEDTWRLRKLTGR